MLNLSQILVASKYDLAMYLSGPVESNVGECVRVQEISNLLEFANNRWVISMVTRSKYFHNSKMFDAVFPQSLLSPLVGSNQTSDNTDGLSLYDSCR